MEKKKAAPVTVLKGWAAIAKFMGTTPASAQTWAKQGMPVKREGRFTTADPAEVQAWLGQQSHMPKPAHILTTSEAAKHVGENVTVCGTVVGVHTAERSNGSPTFVNLYKTYPNQVFTILIWGSDAAKFTPAHRVGTARTYALPAGLNFTGMCRRSWPGMPVGSAFRSKCFKRSQFTWNRCACNPHKVYSRLYQNAFQREVCLAQGDKRFRRDRHDWSEAF
jgi:hypothetical protein